MTSSIQHTKPAPAATNRQRIVTLDLLRSFALLCMAIYHFTYDLELFGYVESGTATSGGWALFAKSIAGSFLFLAGVSLSLAHGRSLRWAAFLRRLTVIAAAALAISVATYFTFPDRFIYFGILHVIAVSSVVGLPFLRVPTAIVAVAALVAFLLPTVFRTEVLNSPFLTWIGLSTLWRPSMDFIPLFPWVAPFLTGICAERLLRPMRGATPRAANATLSGPIVRILAWPGRHSLVVYLLHQPLLIGALLAWSKL